MSLDLYFCFTLINYETFVCYFQIMSFLSECFILLNTVISCTECDEKLM